MDSTKKPWLSKTLITNTIMAVAAFFPGVQAFMQSHPLALVEALTVANIALRLVTKDKISLQD